MQNNGHVLLMQTSGFNFSEVVVFAETYKTTLFISWFKFVYEIIKLC